MRVEAFSFELPPELIALRPAEPRDSARLLHIGLDGLQDRYIRDLSALLNPGDALVVNDTRVIAARLHGVRVRGEAVAHIDATLHKRMGDNIWAAFVRPAKKLVVGERIRFGSDRESGVCLIEHLDAKVIEKLEGGEVLLEFEMTGAILDEMIERVGTMPLPPYIAARRDEDAEDQSDYQTMFAKTPGAVAAPTAGLHFTPALMAAIEARGVSLCQVTLHVGAGTFLPVKVEDTDAHVMHAEWGCVDAATAQKLNDVRARGGKVLAVGTTSLRILESASRGGRIEPFCGDTSIFITPGYEFQAADRLLTNFHLPSSTLFMLVSAFAGLETMQAAYAHAIAEKYRFYSYGDACLIEGRHNFAR
ncbi:MAG: tRNA preQ1(34) S-adenosylmethionine ribosyltransferase-isomerase QueA [Hyphomicrobiales bacterium]|nr:tRNA preQ1(34) S-adenosylmethionine ribosyltransferase-isomerase QueA [Hyphomicrobiales bacterium]MDE2113737.1 tRNA preQ1(34) S-adenosylmethionine ribosyltransferase-isomerase QueA [Hyphomicrobiales bacterium]